ncbi:aspartate aminotransferase family protein [Pontibacter sp. JAM-7]|uniref:aspartate aminotransferase family protein n=1 Tax=Pontibacter sp. JAM-7 TaxID=3366581 RepID=UPI003AF6F7FD
MSHLSPLLQQASHLHVDHGKGCWLFDSDNQAYLDFTSGIGVTSTGHCHPTVITAAKAQLDKVVHAQYTTVSHQPMLDLSDQLAEMTPGDLNSVAFSNSGSEAVETALRLARHATGRSNIICFHGGFHGRTMGAASLTSSGTKVRTGFHPMMAGVVFAPFPHLYRYGWDAEQATAFCLAELDELLVTQSAPDDTAAMIIEPIQGEYGYYPATQAFMQGLEERCRKHNILLICDEIQAGYGRSGRFWSLEHFGVQPDILITAKGLASGFPLSAIAASASLMAKGRPGSQGGTYGANAVACAAALGTLKVMHEENLVANAEQRGIQLRQGLQQLVDNTPWLDDLRGKGLMLGLEVAENRTTLRPDLAAKLTEACERRGLLLLRCGTHGQVVRWLPPLIVTAEEIDDGLTRFTAALTEVNSSL